MKFTQGVGVLVIVSDEPAIKPRNVSNKGDEIMYSSTPHGGVGVTLRLINPLESKTDHLIVQSSRSYIKAYDWSPDDKLVVYCDFTANTTSTMVDVPSNGSAQDHVRLK